MGYLEHGLVMTGPTSAIGSVRRAALYHICVVDILIGCCTEGDQTNLAAHPERGNLRCMSYGSRRIAPARSIPSLVHARASGNDASRASSDSTVTLLTFLLHDLSEEHAEAS